MNQSNKDVEIIEKYNEILRARISERVRGEILAMLFRVIDSSVEAYKNETKVKEGSKKKSDS